MEIQNLEKENVTEESTKLNIFRVALKKSHQPAIEYLFLSGFIQDMDFIQLNDVEYLNFLKVISNLKANETAVKEISDISAFSLVPLHRELISIVITYIYGITGYGSKYLIQKLEHSRKLQIKKQNTKKKTRSF